MVLSVRLKWRRYPPPRPFKILCRISDLPSGGTGCHAGQGLLLAGVFTAFRQRMSGHAPLVADRSGRWSARGNTPQFLGQLQGEPGSGAVLR